MSTGGYGASLARGSKAQYVLTMAWLDTMVRLLRGRPAAPTLVALIVLGALAYGAPASAEVRTGFGHRTVDDRPVDRSIPKVGSLRVRHDTAAGTLELEAAFAAPIPDPSVTSAMRAIRLEVNLSDRYDPSYSCFSGPGVLGTIRVPIADDSAAPQIQAYADVEQDSLFTGDLPEPIVGTRSWNEDRTALSLRFVDPGLVRLSLICVSASTFAVEGDAQAKPLSGVRVLRPFLLDGFTPYDGPWKALAQELMSWSDDLRPRTRCSGSVPGVINCPSVDLGSETLLYGLGVPEAMTPSRIRLKGTWLFRFTGQRYPAITRDVDMAGTVSWDRCPRRLRAKKRGKGCSIALTYRDTGRLAVGDPALGKAVRRAIARRAR